MKPVIKTTPNILGKTTALGLLMIIGMTRLSYADGKAVGLSCTNPPGSIVTTANDTADDLLACVGGTWHSIIYGSSVPSGAVAAFDLPSCPSGWIPAPALAGRTIIGAGAGSGLTPRALDSYGGEEKHAIATAEMPPHNHGFPIYYANSGGPWVGHEIATSFWPQGPIGTQYTANAGDGQPFNVMMPYYALLYCLKQ